MKSKYQHLLVGVLIVLLGVILLLHNFRIFHLDEQLIWGVALIILGGIFLRVYNRNSPKKSILILGIFFIILGIFTSLYALFLIPEDVLGTFLLWIGGAIFISIYIHKNKHWWAIIPGGVFVILGSIIALNAFRLLEGNILWFVFFFGISLIFWFLFLIKDEMNKLDWAIYPALLISIFSFFILSLIGENHFGDILFPLSIIFCGTYLLIKNLLHRRQITPKSEYQKNEEDPSNMF